MRELHILREQKVSPALVAGVEEFRKKYPAGEEDRKRIIEPTMPFYGREILEMAVAGLLEGENLLLTGPKATGKNVLAENLAWIFGRPSYNVSFHVNTGSAELVGTDTFRNNQVELRKGSVCLCAEQGGFGILDEINMAKNEAVSVLHAALDDRRYMDIPGYDRIHLHDAARFIATMNHGYAGTRELNEALVSRFMVIDMPKQTEQTLRKILETNFPDTKPGVLEQFTGVFLDLQEKAENGEISTKALDLRGMIAALGAIRCGLGPAAAMRMGIVNKCFDSFERDIVNDVVTLRIPEEWTTRDVFS
jgi:MoxR-like ATPase